MSSNINAPYNTISNRDGQLIAYNNFHSGGGSIYVGALFDRSDLHERVAALQWASKVPYESHHVAARKGRTENTAEWILQHPTYRDWRASSAPMILWLHGIPGAGKTKVVSRVIDDICEQLTTQPIDEGFAYFYFNRNDASRRDPSAALCSLVRQLALSADGEAVQHALMHLYRENHKRAFPAQCLHDDDAERLLRQFVDVYPQTTVVLDALDECDTRARMPFVDMLDGLASTATKPVRFFISSRLDRDIAERFEAGPNVAIRATDNADDIARYVEAELARGQLWTRKLSYALRKEIVRTLCEKSRGMFQWAVLQLGQLFSLKREKDVWSRLGKLPGDLEKAYDELYAAILNQPESAPIIAERAFKWVMCSFVPMTSKQLVAAVCQDAAADRIQQVDIDIDFVLYACSNLLVVDPSTETCSFSHLSVQEYLESRVAGESQAHALVAKTCLVILLAKSPSQAASDVSSSVIDTPDNQSLSEADDPESGATDTTDSQSYSEDADSESASSDVGNMQFRAIQSYAVYYWHKHVICHGEDDIDPNLAELLKQFLGSMDASGPAYRRWLQRAALFPRRLLNPDTCASLGVCFLGFDRILADWWEGGFDITRHNEDGDSLLHLAVIGKSMNTVSRLLSLGLDPNTSYLAGSRSALSIAILLADARMARILVDAGAHVSAKHDGYVCPLAAAAYKGSVEIVRMLLDAGADVNANGGDNGCRLGASEYHGRPDIVQMLLLGGFCPSTKGIDYGCPLGVAAFHGSVEIVQMLLDAGADVNAKGGDYGCPLGVAARWGGVNRARLLLNAGADVNAKGGDHGCPLSVAAFFDNFEIAQLLLNAGADVNAKGGDYGCPLGAAAFGAKGFERSKYSVQMLLDAGADVNAKGGHYGCPLGTAAYQWRADIVQMLLNAGADLNAKGGRYGCPLGAAAHEGAEEIVRMLLKAGADVNTRGGRFGCPVGAAAYGLAEQTARMLLDAGADVNAKGGRYGCPLGAAAVWGEVEMAQMLLDAGANVNTAGGRYGCPLSVAARKGSFQMVQMLLNAGADVNAKGGLYGCPLGAAASVGSSESAQMLLDAGADANTKGGRYGCPLGAAAAGSSLEVVQMLLHAGADVNAKGGLYGCPLGVAAYFGGVEIVQLLLNAGANVNAEGGRFACPLGAAATERSVEIAQMLLDAGADVNAQGGRYRCPLGAAANFGIVETVQLLLKAGADANAKDNRYGFPLRAAAFSGKVEIVQMLLNAGADVDALGSMCGCALGVAAYYGKVDMAQLLLKSGADIDLRGGSLAKQQLRAARANGGVFVRLQLEAPAKDDDGDGRLLNAALSAALESSSSNVELVRMLLSAWGEMPVRVGAPRVLECEQAQPWDDDYKEEGEDDYGDEAEEDEVLEEKEEDLCKVTKRRRYSA